MKYSIEFKTSAIKSLERLPKNDQIGIAKKIKQLADDPRPSNCVKLSDSPYYRIRHGDYRVIYAIEDDRLIILILKIGHRKDAYK